MKKSSFCGKFLIFLGAGASKPFCMKTAKELYGGFWKEEVQKFLDMLQLWIRPTNEDKEIFKGNILRLQRFVEKILKRRGGRNTLDDLFCLLWIHSALDELKELLRRIPSLSEVEQNGHDLISLFHVGMGDLIYDYLIREFWQVKQRKTKTLLWIYDSLLEHFGPSIDIFTTNVDLCTENYCLLKRRKCRTGYVDDGPLRPFGRKVRFAPEEFKKDSIRLYKLHGSVDLATVPIGEEVRLTEPKLTRVVPSLFVGPAGFVSDWIRWDRTGKVIPTGGLVQERFAYLMNMLVDKLKKANGCLIAGYSFGDTHIVEAFKQAGKRRRATLKTCVIDLNPNLKNRLRELEGYNFAFKHVIGSFYPGTIREAATWLSCR